MSDGSLIGIDCLKGYTGLICVGTTCAFLEYALIGPILTDLDPAKEHLSELVGPCQGDFAVLGSLLYANGTPPPIRTPSLS